MTGVLLVTGSRDWRNLLTLRDFVQAFDHRYAGDCHLINGYAKGADLQTRAVAIELGWTYEDHFPANYRRPGMSYGQAAYARNAGMVERLVAYRGLGESTEVLALWRDHSRGTGHTIDISRANGFEPTIQHDCACCLP